MAEGDAAVCEMVVSGSCQSGSCQSGRGEIIMASKDKGGRSSKTPATKTAKEKRKAKREKKAGKGS